MLLLLLIDKEDIKSTSKLLTCIWDAIISFTDKSLIFTKEVFSMLIVLALKITSCPPNNPACIVKFSIFLDFNIPDST